MNNGRNNRKGLAGTALVLVTAFPLIALAQTPVDDDGNPVGSFEPSPAEIETVVGNEDIPLMSETDLEELVGPIALYPDELLAIVLPASAYPLQIVDAARFLEALEEDPSLKPDPEWDDSVVALLNYPEIIEHLNEDMDWTWRLGEAVVAQQTDVVAAIERFRDRAYAAGNLKSDSYQNVTHEDGVIEISPVSDDVIYVPYYEPERVVVYQPRPVYYYYPRAYPVYYYPYSAAYHFESGYFWGVTTAFTIGWLTDSLHVYHHSYHGHPYYGWTYRDRWWYRRPPISVYNTTYVRNTRITINNYYEGDRWSPRRDRNRYIHDERTVRNWHYGPDRYSTDARVRNVRREQPRYDRNREQQPRQQQPITFRERQQNDEPNAYRKKERSIPVLGRDRDQRSSRQETTARQQSPRTDSDNRIQLTRREDVSKKQRSQREPAVRQQQPRREPVTRQQQPRPVTVARQQQPRRETATRSQPRRESVVQQQPRRQDVRSQPQRREHASAPRPERSQQRAAPQRTESRRSESRAKQENRRSETRAQPQRREDSRAKR